MGGTQIYTGVDSTFTVSDLEPGRCYTFRVRALIEGAGWTQFSPTTSASTLNSFGGLTMAQIEAKLTALRKTLLQYGGADVTIDPCPLAGYATPDFLDAHGDAITYSATLDRTSAVGLEAAAINCRYALCDALLPATQPFGPGMQGILQVPKDGLDATPHEFVSRFVSLSAGNAVLSYADPAVASQRASFSVLGCRAEVVHGWAFNCFAVNCSSSITRYIFCVDVASLKQVGVLDSWVDAINYASHGVVRPGKYEVAVKVGLAPIAADNKRRTKQFAMLEVALFRDAWVMSFLSSLADAKVSPHFPRLLDVFRCMKLPDKYSQPPFGGPAAGSLPLHTWGGMVMAASRSVQMDSAGGASSSSFHWGVTAMELFNTDLQQVLDANNGPYFSPQFARGLLLQLTYALAVGRHAFGLHHNQLLRLKTIKLLQTPRGSPEYRRYMCFRASDEFLTGLPLKVRSKHPGEFVSGRSVDGDPDFLFINYPADQVDCEARKKPTVGRRTSWCLSMSDVDGFTLKLHDFSMASLSRKQLEWWAGGYAFPNTAWRDDLKDIGLSLCPVLSQKTHMFALVWVGALEEFCALLRQGTYQVNPAAALTHRLFSNPEFGVPTIDDVIPEDRIVYEYDPATVAELSPTADARGRPSTAGYKGDSPRAAPQHENPPIMPKVGKHGIQTEAPVGRSSLGSAETAMQSTTSRATGAQASTLDSLGAEPAVPSNRAAPGIKDAPGHDPASQAWPQSVRLRKPWIVHKDVASVTLQWVDLRALHDMPRDPTYNLFINGVSVYSGPDVQFRFEATSTALSGCLIADLAVFIRGVGWSNRSPSATINDCNEA